MTYSRRRRARRSISKLNTDIFGSAKTNSKQRSTDGSTLSSGGCGTGGSHTRVNRRSSAGIWTSATLRANGSNTFEHVLRGRVVTTGRTAEGLHVTRGTPTPAPRASRMHEVCGTWWSSLSRGRLRLGTSAGSRVKASERSLGGCGRLGSGSGELSQCPIHCDKHV